MDVKVQGVDDDRVSGECERIVTALGNLLGEIHKHLVTNAIHLGTIGLAVIVVPQRGHAAIFNFTDVFRERDGEILEALHRALGGIDGDLLIERVGVSLNVEPERQGQQCRAVNRERALGEMEKILS